MDNLADIAQAVATCTKCPLSEKRTHAVPGEGSPNSELLFIGEGPGQKEDEQGRPFVGSAGKFLEELLSTINLTRKDVFITNVVKCRPPGNRDPEPNEVDTCTELYLYKQIAIIKPKLIITLGRHSMYRFLPETFKISQVHGKPFRRKEQVYLPLYHPAAALYNGGMRQTLIDDFKRIPKVLEKV
ncbi:MAG: uracil-DNA glycosylase [Candidatus Kerfeldbacteria bacterium RIFCSPLOWO2_01_FULL_48_11]|uniref:Type-4 uracil-DNA glycosylase n=1 Tax=Candidatus Kerfeldbacteria bacterium RIFCSPLOWO2_01_FULL_48_11 TaxID=1798543 RepID=A0A1G2B8X9_9BACT|nr:MAG: Phage SPO1 DNA polymerase-related protein [Parcubacteria group bacterium GW2011_GWA2_48_9]OGY84667.1 MAG: uracil-DNA glycosylase [Candidatus Kerfeldbacteria bacterium RIFCSPLOWO2_01_FULL_48_11]